MNRHPDATTGSLDADGVEAGPTPAPHRMRTDRLALHRVHPDEVEFDRLHALFADAADPGEVFELCGWDAHEGEAATRAYLDDRTDRWERGAFHEYVLESAPRDGRDDPERGAGEYVGTACVEVAEDGSGEFGFWLRKPYWGRGLCGEGTDALVHAAFECLGAPYVVAGCLPANDRSRRAIEKFVGRYGGAYFGSPPRVRRRSDDPEAGSDGSEGASVGPHHEWVITREQYDSSESGISTLVPGVEYADVEF